MTFLIPLTIARIPEVQSLPTAMRAQILSNAKAPGPVRLWCFNFVRGVACTLVLTLLGHNLGLGSLAALPSVAFIIGVLLISMAIAHTWTITRIRGQIRFGIEEASRGSRTPICTSCGYDCSEVNSDQCPECGASRQIPSDSG
jgi:hypothetical protein